MHWTRHPILHLVGAALGVVILTTSCDQVPSSETGDGQRPLVSDLVVIPDSVTAGDLAPTEQDSVGRDTVTMLARAQDPDGTIERVVFTIEPSSNPRGTASGRLEELPEDEFPGFGENLYGRSIILPFPRFVDEVYTVRIFSVDDDSLESNQGIAQFRYLPDE